MNRYLAVLLAGCISVALATPAYAVAPSLTAPRAASPAPVAGSHNPSPPAPNATESHPDGASLSAPLAPTTMGTFQWQNPKPSGNPFYGIACPTTSVCYAAGFGWPIMVTNNAGTTWTQETGVQFLNAISCFDAVHCVAVGDSGAEIDTSNGTSWSVNTVTSSFLSGVSCPSASVCVAVGAAGEIWRTVNGGATWTAQSSATPNDLFAVSCNTTLFCVAVGDAGTITRTTNGSTWSTASSASGLLPFFGVSCPATATCTAVGQNGYSPFTSDSGATWTNTVTPPTALTMEAVSCGAATQCFAAGTDGAVYVEAPCSTTVNQVGCWERTSNAETGALHAVSCPSASQCLAAGDYGIIVRTSNGGSGWVKQSPNAFTTMHAVSCPSTSVCFAVGNNPEGEGTTDGGATWSLETVGVPDHTVLWGLSCPSTTVCYAVGDGGDIFGTTDGGAQWSAQTSPTTNDLKTVSCPSTSTCFAGSAAGDILATTNSGATWSPQTSGTTSPIYGISCASTSVCYAVGAMAKSIGTTNGGTNWNAQGNIGTTAETLNGLSCPSTTTCFATGPTKIHVTTDSGVTWTDTAAPTGQWTAISCFSTTVCTATVLGDVYFTTDGTAWNPQATPASSGQLYGVSCPSATECVADGFRVGTGSGGIIVGTADGSATQWRWLAPSGTTADLTGVSCPSTTVCYAVAGYDILGTTNGGTLWLTQRVAATTTTFHAISCPSTSVCFAVDSTDGFPEGPIFVTTNGGVDWTPQLVSTLGVFNPGYVSISCPTTTVCFAVSAAGSEIHTTNGGTSWTTPAQVSTATSMSAVSCPSSTVCFAADHGTPGHVYSTTNGGTSWSLSWNIATDPNAGGSGPFLAIDCPDLLRCFATGASGLIATTSDSGANWRSDVSQSSADLTGVSCTSSCFVTGSDSSIQWSVDNGGTWFSQFPNLDSAYAAISCVSSDTCVAVGSGGAIAATTTHGDAWSSVSPSTGDTASIHAMSCYGSSNCYAAAEASLFDTHDGGATWTSTAFANGDQFAGVSCPGALTCYAVGWPGAIYKTIDGGSNWLPQPNLLYGVDETLIGVSCANFTNCVAAGTDGIVLSTTDGTNWNPESSGTSGALLGISCPTTSSCVAVGLGGLSLTRTGGTWASHPSGTTHNLNGVTCVTANTCYAVGDSGTLRLTTNRGVSWTAKSSAVLENLRGIACTKPSFCVAVGDFGTGIATVDGATWKSLSVPTLNDLRAAAFPDLDHAWLAGLGGTILANASLIPSCTSVSVAPDVASPQAIGAIVTLTGVAAGCPDSSPAYRFYLRTPAGVWSIVRNFSSNPSFAWNTASYAPGTYLIGVWAKDTQSGFTYDAYAFGTFTLQRMPCIAVDVQSDVPSPEASGMLVNFSVGDPPGCPQPLEQWWVRNPAGVWSIVSPYASGNNTYAWHTTGLVDGTYQVGAWAKQQGSTKPYEAYGFVTYTLYSGAIDAVCHSVNVTADTSSPLVIGPTVTLTAFANCDTPQYKWWVRNAAGSWAVVRNYSSTATYAWATNLLPAGTYQLGAWAHQGGSTASYQAYSFITFTLIKALPNFISVTLAPDLASPRAPGTTITFTANSLGLGSPDFQFWVLAPGGTWTIVQPYSGPNTYSWDTAGLSPGPWQIGVWTRQVTSTASYQAFAFITFQLTFG